MHRSKPNLDELMIVPAFSKLSSEQLATLGNALVRKVYSAGEFIFHEGALSSGIWFVTSGRVRIAKQSLSGRLQGLCMVNKGTCFGGCPLFDGEVNPASAQAIDQVTLLIVPRDEVEQLICQDTRLANTLLTIFCERLEHLARISEGLGSWASAYRINDCLLLYADQAIPHPVVSLTHEKLAVLAGTGREVVSRHLSRLQKAGVVQIEPGAIILLNVDGLGCPTQQTQA